MVEEKKKEDYIKIVEVATQTAQQFEIGGKVYDFPSAFVKFANDTMKKLEAVA